MFKRSSDENNNMLVVQILQLNHDGNNHKDHDNQDGNVDKHDDDTNHNTGNNTTNVNHSEDDDAADDISDKTNNG